MTIESQNTITHIVVGSLNADLVQPLPRLPALGETVVGGEIRVIPGGKGANQAVTLGNLGGAVAMIGQTGEDQFAKLLFSSLEAASVDTSQVGCSPGATGTAAILVLPDGENLIVIAPAANAKLTPDIVQTRLDHLLSQSAAPPIVLCQLEIPLASTAVALEIAYSRGCVTLLDPAPAQPLSPQILSHVSYLTPNQTEAAALLGRSGTVESYEDAEGAASRLAQLIPGTVVLKLGALGCVVADRRHCFRVSGFPVTAVDTTGAGDTFNGAFALALSEHMPLEQAARFANAAAALSVTRFGAQSSIPRRSEVEAFLATHRVAQFA